MHRPDPPEIVAQLGHVVEWDPPAALTAVHRWTCVKCGRAVLLNGTYGRVYGSATTERCPDAVLAAA